VVLLSTTHILKSQSQVLLLNVSFIVHGYYYRSKFLLLHTAVIFLQSSDSCCCH